jgi:hypothetical protein
MPWDVDFALLCTAGGPADAALVRVADVLRIMNLSIRGLNSGKHTPAQQQKQQQQQQTRSGVAKQQQSQQQWEARVERLEWRELSSALDALYVEATLHPRFIDLN